MANLQKFQAKVCWTAAGWLLHDEKVLLIHHKKLNIWLAPGGHVDEGELPHQAAEREFWEEAGIRVLAFSKTQEQIVADEAEELPNPFHSNLHWISQGNYDVRTGVTRENTGPKGYQRKSCEQHLGLCYFVKPADLQQVQFKQNIEETLGIGWFDLDEIEQLQTKENIREEARFVFREYPR